MKIFIASYGTRGDVQPYVALGKGLIEAGHEVMLATSERFANFVTEHGLQYGYMNDQLLAVLDSEQGRDLIENTRSAFDIVKQSLRMMKQVGPMQRALLDETWVAAESFEPDLIVFHPKAFACPHIAEFLQVPVVLALLIPSMVPTGEQTNMGFPRLGLGRWYNRFSYRCVNYIMALTAGKFVKALRAERGLPRQKRFNLLATSHGKPIPVVHAISPSLVRRPVDWPDHVTMPGFWYLSPTSAWQPAQDLVDFLAAGPPPVYVGFGSMVGRNPERLARIVILSLQQLGLRGILARGWGGLAPEDLPESCLLIDQVPHEWLFPRVAAVVHHGGAGTTAAAVRAGKPSVVVPFFGDQPYWGQRLQAKGVAPEAIAQKDLSVEKLCSALNQVTTNSALIENAKRLGAAVCLENGVADTIALLEKIASSAGQVHGSADQLL